MKRHPWLIACGVIIAVLLIAAAVFRADWLLPMAVSRASTMLGRTVTAEHLSISLGRTTRVEVTGVVIANPPDWPGGGNFATIERLGIDLLPIDYLRGKGIVVPIIDLQAPHIDAQQAADGKANWVFPSSPATAASPKLGMLRIAEGTAHVVSQKLPADVTASFDTHDNGDGTGQLTLKSQGTYAKQPITAQFTGGAVLSLRDASRPYPINLTVTNGPTHITLKGTVQDPIAFAGADLRLDLAGPDMALLLPLTGIAIPKTPAYQVSGMLDDDAGVLTFKNIIGHVGTSDLAGSLSVDTKPDRPVVTADLSSKQVDLKDLGGFIGAEPGDAARGTKAPVRNNGKVLPNIPVSLPKLNAADVHLHYQAAAIEGRRQPLDRLVANLDIVNGNVTLKPLSVNVGPGHITADIALEQKGNQLRTRATISFVRVDLEKLLAATGIAHGTGTVGGSAVIDGTGRSFAEILGDGNGNLKLFMAKGGDLSALLVDLSGLEFGNAVLSALGIPNRARIDCMITDFGLKQGIATVGTAMLDTSEARIVATGNVNLHTESLDLRLQTDAKHFSIGSLNTPMLIRGTLASPSIMPDPGPLAVKGAAAIALGIIGTPLAALLPTIQLGIGDDDACATLIHGKPRAK